jgi:DNA-directed RNA polymerase specialized sigma24 family protein
MSRSASMPALSEAAKTALGKFEKARESSLTATDPLRKMYAQESVNLAMASLSKREAAIIDFWMLRHVSIADIATKANMTTDDVGDLIREAADALVRHYERIGAGDG